MSKKNYKLIFQIVLTGILFLSTMTFPKAETVVESLGNEEVIVEVSQEYNIEENKEIINLSVTNKLESVTVQGLELPDGSYEEQTTGTYTYEVTENAEHVFKVKYVVQEEELLIEKEYDLLITTSSIQNNSLGNEGEIINLLAPITDNAVTVSVAGYEPSLGWEKGIVYDVVITVNFGDTTSTGKKVIVEIPEGMKYVGYPVITTPTSGTPEFQMPSPASGFTESVVTPARQTYYPSYNGGLVYNVKQNSTGYEITLKVTVDDTVFYGDKLIVDGIKVSAEKAGSSIGEVAIDVDAKGTFTSNTYFVVSSESVTRVLGDTDILTLPVFMMGYENPYILKAEVYIYYPEGAIPVSVTNQVNQSTMLTDGYLLAEFNNAAKARDVLQTYAKIQIDGLSLGTHTATEKNKIVITYYDGTVKTFEHNTKTYVQIVAEATNKLTIEATSRAYADVTSEYFGGHVKYFLRNGNLSEATEQWIEFEIDQDYEAVKVYFDSTLANVSEIQYMDSSEPGVLKSATVTTVDGQPGISVESVGLGVDTYFTYVIAKIGDYAKGYKATSTTSTFNTHGVAQVVGRLASGKDSASVTITTFTYESDGSTRNPNSISSKSVTVTRTTFGTVSANTSASNIMMIAGNTEKVTFGLNPTSVTNGSNTAAKNPSLIVKVPSNVSFKNFEATQDGNNVLDEVVGPYIVNGETYYQIKTNTYIGRFIDDQIYGTISISFDIEASLLATGTYSWATHSWWYTESGRFAELDKYGILDADDVNNNGLVTDYVQSTKGTNALVINDLKALLIDTYIVPSGEERKPGYDNTSEASKEATAVGFTPVTTGEYNVTILNNRDSNVDKVITYIPVPKTGYNFGSNYQGSAFAWDMKLSGTPNVEVTVNGVTDSSRVSNYVLEYATVANGGDPEAASYSSIATASTNMIRVTNTSGILPQEEAKFVFVYEVNESTASVEANPEKLGGINDFMPYYYFEAGSAGYQNGTRVGAILQIGVISGQVFVDKDYDGVKNNSDTWMTSGTVRLIKADGSVAGTTTLNSSGEYKFENLAAGTYKIDFSGVLNSSNYQYFTFKGQTGDINSKADQSGSNVGYVLNVDPTTEEAKEITVGILDYNPASLTVTGSAVTVQAGNAQNSGTTASITTTLNNSNFDKVKATTGAYSYVSNATGTATVNSGGVVTGVAAGSTTVTITVTDIFGNTKTGTSTVTVTSNNLPVVTVSSNTVTLELGQSFDKTSYITGASDVEDTTLSASDVVITGTPNVNAVGSFSLTYRLTDTDGNYAEEVIVFTVADTVAPVINSVTNTSITFEYGDTIDQASVLAKLGTVSVTELATYTTSIDGIGLLNLSLLDTAQSVNLYATDASSNQSAATVISITIVDTTAPTISVENTLLVHPVGTSLSESELIGLLGSIVKNDNYTVVGLLETEVEGFSSVDTDTVGAYAVDVYTVDESGNESDKVTITINVVDEETPVISVDVSEVTYTVGSEVSESQFLSDIGLVVVDNYYSEDDMTITTSFSTVDLGESAIGTVQLVTVTVTDSSGNSTSITIQVHVIRKIVYYIEGENITIHYNDLQEHVNNGVLENKLIELTSAKAWQDCPQTGITDLPVYVKDITPLMNAKGGETIQLELSLVGSSSMSTRLVSNTTEMEELVHVVTIVVEAPSNVGSPTAPSTGVSQTVGIAGFGVIVSGLLLVLASKLKRKENI